jgi:hypothetical protein
MSKKTCVVTEPATQLIATAPEHFLSDIEIEASFGIPRKTLQNWRLLGRGPLYRKFGNSVRRSGDLGTESSDRRRRRALVCRR